PEAPLELGVDRHVRDPGLRHLGKLLVEKISVLDVSTVETEVHFESLVRDPFELNNLIEDPGLVDVRKRLRESLDQWMHAQQDPGSEQDTWLSLEASRLGKHRFGPPAVKLSK
ncbi:MAG: hypothetical protein ACO3PR_15860, partial [Limisphaerales bacterium]